MRSLSRAQRVLFVALLVPWVCIAIAFFIGPRTALNELQTLRWPHEFSVEDWRTHPSQRWQMAEDLTRGSQLRGKTPAQVRRMLGGVGAMGVSASGDLVWSVPSPQRPNDLLIVLFEDDVVVRAALTNDVERYY